MRRYLQEDIILIFLVVVVCEHGVSPALKSPEVSLPKTSSAIFFHVLLSRSFLHHFLHRLLIKTDSEIYT